MIAAVGSAGRPEATRNRARKVLRKRLEHACSQPALRLLIHGEPGRQIVGHGAPCDAVSQHLTQAVKQLAQRMLTLRRAFVHERQIGRNQRLFFVADIGRIRFANRSHPILLSQPATKVHNTL
jgi:hypothetical protein